MFGNCFNNLFGAVVAMALIFVPATVSADPLNRTKTVGGMTVHLGLMPAAALQRDPCRVAAQDRVSLPSGANVYHVMLALFDTATGARITDAAVDARISPLTLAGVRKPLVAIAEAGAVTYCNYFRIAPKDIYRVKVEIRRPETATLDRTEFILRPDRG